MLLPEFEFHEPETVSEACGMLDNLGSLARPLAGGTDLLVNMKKNILSPAHLISLSRAKYLNDMGRDNGSFIIGACVTAAELAGAKDVKKFLPALSTAASGLGSPLVRNLATVAGNLVSARPAADFPPPLMAYDASVVLKSSSGERAVSLWDFFTGPGTSVINTGEILTQIRIPRPSVFSGAAYIKFGVRKAMEISLVNVAAFIELDKKDGFIKEARVAIGSAAPTPIRAPSAEKALFGEKPGDKLFSEAGRRASQDISPIDDFRASAEYKTAMVEVLAKRALNMALEDAGKRS